VPSTSHRSGIPLQSATEAEEVHAPIHAQAKGPNGKRKQASGANTIKPTLTTFSECQSVEYHKKKEGQKGNNWKKKAEENKTYTRKELNAILKKVTTEEKKTWSKEKPSKETIYRKRKAEKAKVSMLDEAESQSERSELEETNSTITSTTTNTDRKELDHLDELLDNLSVSTHDS
jgi:hypothetical protein